MDKKHSFAISSIIRQNRNNSDGLAPVYLRIACDGKRSEISVKILVDPGKWNPAKGRVKGNSEDTRRLNQCIETFEHRAREIYNKCILTGKVITAEAIKNELISPAANQHFLVVQMQKFVSDIEKKVGNGYFCRHGKKLESHPWPCKRISEGSPGDRRYSVQRPGPTLSAQSSAICVDQMAMPH